MENNDYDFLKEDKDSFLNFIGPLVELIGMIIIFSVILKFHGLIMFIITILEAYFFNLIF